MMSDARKSALAERLALLEQRVTGLEALHPQAHALRALSDALARGKAQLVEASDALLTVLLVGGTGAGKSSLINALAGKPIADVSTLRPCTHRATLYLHQAADSAVIEALVASDARIVRHARTPLLTKVLIDTPDLDSYQVANREYTVELLKRADLVLYVFNPENYRDERIWSVLKRERRFSACAVVLNKRDEVDSPAELEEICADLRGLFAREGVEDVRIFRTSAGLHGRGLQPKDDLAGLAGFLQEELDASAAARIKQRQQRAVLGLLEERVDAIAPRGLDETLGGLSRDSRDLLAPHAEKLVERLQPEIDHLSKDVEPLLAVQSHALFRGPLRAWLGLSAALRYGLVRRFVTGAGAGSTEEAVERVLARADRSDVRAAVRGAELAVQDRLFRAELPLQTWEVDGEGFLTACARRVRDEVLGTRVRVSPWQRWLARALDIGAGTVLFAASLWGLYALALALWTGSLNGLTVLAHLFAVVCLTLIVFHGLSRALIPSLDARRAARSIETGVRDALRGWLAGRLERYGAGLRAEIEGLRAPLTELRGLLDAPPEVVQEAEEAAGAGSAPVVSQVSGVVAGEAPPPAGRSPAGRQPQVEERSPAAEASAEAAAESPPPEAAESDPAAKDSTDSPASEPAETSSPSAPAPEAPAAPTAPEPTPRPIPKLRLGSRLGGKKG